jgi:hypothetical protein
MIGRFTLKMKNQGKHLFRLTMMIGMLCLVAIPAKVAAQGVPSGSYQQTCQVLGVDGTVLQAKCKTRPIDTSIWTPAKDGIYRKTSLDFEFCIDDIRNDDGRLTCAKDLEAEKKKQAEKAAEEANKQANAALSALVSSSQSAFAAAAPLVLGRPTSPGEVASWIPYIKSYGMSQQLQEGFKFSDAVAFLKKFISQPAGIVRGAQAIEYAFQEVYGRYATPLEQAYWESQIKAQKAWYAPIVSAELSKLNQDSAMRKAVINHAYQLAFGRDANSVDLQYWQPRSEHFRQLLAAQRTWLYSANGAKDLVETTTRALQKVNGKAPTDDQVKAAMKYFSIKNATYRSMVKHLEKNKS